MTRMFDLMLKIEKIPNPVEFASKYGNTEFQKILILIAIYIPIFALLMFEKSILQLFDSNYWTLMFAYILNILLVATILLWTIKDTKFEKAGAIIIGLLMLTRIVMVIPFDHTYDQTTGIENNRTYVVYRKNCEYCQKAHIPMLSAVNLYNATHKDQIHVIERDDNTKTAKALTTKIEATGSVYKQIGTKSNQAIYVQMDNHENPVRPKVNDVYQTILGVEHGG